MTKCGTGASASRHRLIAIAALALIAAGCGGGGGGGGQAQPQSKAPPPAPTQPPADDPQPEVPGNTPPTIHATPPLEVVAGTSYSVIPEALDPDGDALAFSIENRPAWAQFSTVTGELSGSPSSADVGTYADITISVSDGKTTVALPAFTVSVAAPGPAPAGNAAQVATLQWDIPTQALDGVASGELAGFRIHYGASPDMLVETIEVPNPGLSSYAITDLPPGTYYFAVRTVTASGEQSPLSNVIEMTIG